MQIVLNSMHRYQPRIYVLEARDASNTLPTTSVDDGLSTFVFAETQFIAVTAYQNDKVCMTLRSVNSTALTGIG